MISEYDREPIPGLPGMLPPGEEILWQGAPDRAALARGAFHTRTVAVYFAILACGAAGVAVSSGGYSGVVMTAMLGCAGVGLLHLLAWASARSTLYTLTNRRVVLRVGVAVPKCINVPLALVGAVDFAAHPGGCGDVALSVTGHQRLGYLALWPHARPWKLAVPQPMLRALPDGQVVASLIARTCLAAHPHGRLVQPEPRAVPVPDFAEVAAA